MAIINSDSRLSSEQIKELWNAHTGTIVSVISNRCHTEERRQNALAWAWYLFPRYLEKAENPLQAAIAAATYGSCRRQTFGHTRPPYRDALDQSERYEYPDRIPEPQPRTSSWGIDSSWSIDDMPDRLQPVARAAARGLNRTQTAELLGVSTKTVQRRCDEIAGWLVDQVCAAVH